MFDISLYYLRHTEALLSSTLAPVPDRESVFVNLGTLRFWSLVYKGLSIVRGLLKKRAPGLSRELSVRACFIYLIAIVRKRFVGFSHFVRFIALTN